jgi:hypothetical protein
MLRKSTTPTGASSSPQDLSGLATDAAGNHVVYVPTSTSFTTINKTGDTTTTNNPPPPAPTPGPTTATAFVRARYSSASVKAYDDAHPGGVPIRSAASGTASVIRLQPFGSSITISGGQSSGSSNLPGGLGSTQWLPVAGGGYINAFDVTGLQSGNYGDGGARALPVMGPALPVLKWDMPYTAMPGHTLASIAKHVSYIARSSGAPGNTLVTAQQLGKYNNVRQVSTGQTIMVPRWTTGGYHA